MRIRVRGAVQGVGFRPFVFRLASILHLNGWVINSPQGVVIEVEGRESSAREFLVRLEPEKPPAAIIQSLEPAWLDAAGYRQFEIRSSDHSGPPTALVMPDLATCPECQHEILDPANRRFFYPFTNCTNCGPRFSIIHALPYDRANTTMAGFEMCPACLDEYHNPLNRRFHAQPNACPVCGPQIDLWDATGRSLADRPDPNDPANRSRHLLIRTAEALRNGSIVAIKGIGGFHLMVMASHEEAVLRLRRLKHREEKPFALMYPDMESIRADCEVSPLENRLLRSAQAPIVLLRRRKSEPRSRTIADSVAPGNPNAGIMLPSNPLHHLLMALLKSPVVATSGNLRDEPICIDEQEALERLGGIADFFMVHNRPILRHEDDSIVRVMLDRETVLRRARGYAPLPLTLQGPSDETSETLIAFGAHLKNNAALAIGSEIFLSQHIGDLETSRSVDALENAIDDLTILHAARPDAAVADSHPDYASTALAKRSGLPVIQVQHHVAHVLSCMAENELEGSALGVAWDGTGLGTDGTIWGGEFFRVTDSDCERVAHLRQFRLPGGERAVREPWRAALGLLYALHGPECFRIIPLPAFKRVSPANQSLLLAMLKRGLNSPITSSAGRLFDGVAALIGLRDQSGFEGQAAMDLEFATGGYSSSDSYAFAVESAPEMTTLNWGPLVADILRDIENGAPAGLIASRFHNTLTEMIVAIARRTGEERVVLSGGCFQNRVLTEHTVHRLRQDGFRVYWHQRVPPNDGGIALGQVHAARRELRKAALCV